MIDTYWGFAGFYEIILMSNMKITNNKKINRIETLSDYREKKKPYGLNRDNFWAIEISEKAINKLRKIGDLRFNISHFFKNSENGEEGYYVVIEGMKDTNKYDFTYNVQGKIRPYTHVCDRRFYIMLEMEHVDVSMTFGRIERAMELIAIYIDKKYGNDCGFKINYDLRNTDIYFADKKYNKILTLE